MFGLSRKIAVVAVASLVAVFGHAQVVTAGSANGNKTIVVDGNTFTLHGDNVSYRFHADNTTGDLLSDHFGGSITGSIPKAIVEPDGNSGWVSMPGRVRREFPDQGRGDFRIPGVRIRQSAGHTVSDLQYKSYTIVEYSSVAADLSYSVFPRYDAIVRSVNLTNQGQGNITIEALASLSVDMPFEDLEMISLRGDWAREALRERRRVEYGIQSFGSSTGYSSHFHNPFLSLVHPSTTESHGEAWGFLLVYTGSFSVDVEKSSRGFTRALLGLNPNQLSWQLEPNKTLTSPECVSVYSPDGVGGMARSLHRLYRNYLMKSKFATSNRPVLLNSWGGLRFNYNQSSIYHLAEESAALGAKLFVMDDGWFGSKPYPRTSTTAGLGDWEPNPARFPDGLEPLVNNITENLKAANTSAALRFGVEPEMVNPNSTLYHEHPEWALHAGAYPRTLQRNQLVLNLGLREVQDFIIESVTNIIQSVPDNGISYIKWDNNRGIHETPSPSIHHAYILGLYRVFGTLTSRFPDILWEGCASGGGRFDPGVLQYFPQVWTSDDTDAVERISIQLGTSLAYPPSAMGAHISTTAPGVRNKHSGRASGSIPIELRAHVAMMGRSFGLEFNPADLDQDEKAALPGLIALAEKVNPLVLKGDMWRLSIPGESNWPAVLFIAEDGGQAVLFYFQLSPNINHATPWVRLQGLDRQAMYSVDDGETYFGATLMNMGLQFAFSTDYGSKVVFLEKQ